MERIVPIEIGAVPTIGNVDVDWFEDDDSHTFKFNLPGIYNTYVDFEAHMCLCLFHYIL